MQQRRKPASAAAPAATKQPPPRRPSTPLSLAGLVVTVFLVATFLYNEEDVVKTTAHLPLHHLTGEGSGAARARSPDLRVLQEAAHHEVNARHRHHDEEAEEPQGKEGGIKSSSNSEEGTEQESHHHQQQQEPGRLLEKPDAAVSGGSSSSSSPPAPVVRLAEGCDLYKGWWTYDAAGEQAPLYREAECEFLTEQVTCMRNGRRDDSYQKWRWQPADCDLPRFDARVLLERLRNKRLMLVGDSLNRNQWESMVCLVQSVIPPGTHKKSLAKFVNNGSLNVFTAHDYNATVEFYWAPFLVQSNSDDPQVHSVLDRVIAWRAIAKHANNWKGVDYLVFNTYIWWLNTFDIKVLKGGAHRRAHDQQPLGWSKYALVDRPIAYREVLKTWAKWVDRHIDPAKTTVFFMGMSPNHVVQRNFPPMPLITCG